ncbi:MAG: peptidase MA family metallohydrolase [bacterium]
MKIYSNLIYQAYLLFCLGLTILWLPCTMGLSPSYTVGLSFASALHAGNHNLPRTWLPDCKEEWLIIETPHFTIHYTAVDEYFSRELAALAEESYDLVTTHLGLHPDRKTTLYLASSKEVFISLQPAPSPISEQAVGLAYPGLFRILLLSPRAASSGTIQLEKTFIHELTHIVLGSASFSRPSVLIPTWFNEGVCMHEAGEWNWHYQTLMTRICLTRTIIPFRQLEHSFPSDPDQLQTAYVQSISMVSFILDTYGENSLRKIVHLLIRGDEIDKALTASLGLGLDELEILWKKRLRLLYTWVPVLTSSLVLWFIISIVFLLVYYRKRRISLAKLSAWEEDDIEEWLKKQLSDLDGL